MDWKQSSENEDAIANHYQYSSLKDKQIRLLVPIRSDDEPIYRLDVVDLHTEPVFVAISYAWEGQEADQIISCSGATLKVTKNVYGFLKYWQIHGSSMPLWIDAVCINQADKEEKSRQVSFMGQLYRRAHTVYISLGEGDDLILNAMEEMPDLVSKLGSVRFNNLTDFLDHPGLPPPDAEIWQGIANLFALSWFKRLWTMQEAVLPAGDVYVRYGCVRQSFEIMSTLCRSLRLVETFFLVDEEVLMANTTNAMSGITTTFLIEIFRREDLDSEDYYSDPEQILLWIAYGQRKPCNDPRDRVYAFLGFARQQLRDHIRVDYTLSPGEVYLQFARAWVELENPFGFLCQRVASAPFDGVPSWCPDLACKVIKKELVYLQTCSRYQASGQSQKDLALHGNGRVLAVKGFIVDEVSDVLAEDYEVLMFVDEFDPQVIQRAVNLQKKYRDYTCKTYIGAHPDEATAVEKHVAALTATRDLPDTNASEEIELSARTYDMWLQDLGRQSHEDGASRPTAVSTQDIPSIEFFHMTVTNTMRSRRFFSTRSGRIGVGSAVLQPGDKVCIFMGAQVPFCLRPVGTEGRYIWLEEAYVDGLMQGEAMEMQGPGGIPDEVFLIE